MKDEGDLATGQIRSLRHLAEKLAAEWKEAAEEAESDSVWPSKDEFWVWGEPMATYLKTLSPALVISMLDEIERHRGKGGHD
jgi:hypothetical protein